MKSTRFVPIKDFPRYSYDTIRHKIWTDRGKKYLKPFKVGKKNGKCKAIRIYRKDKTFKNVVISHLYKLLLV